MCDKGEIDLMLNASVGLGGRPWRYHMRSKLNWVNEINSLTPSEDDLIYQQFRRYFSDNPSQIEAVFPQLNYRGKAVVLEEWPSWAPRLLSLITGADFRLVSSTLSIEKLFSLAESIYSVQGEDSSHFLPIAEALSRQNISALAAYFEMSLPNKLKRHLFKQLNFECQIKFLNYAPKLLDELFKDVSEVFRIRAAFTEDDVLCKVLVKVYPDIDSKLWTDLVKTLNERQLLKLFDYLSLEQFMTLKHTFLELFEEMHERQNLIDYFKTISNPGFSDIVAYMQDASDSLTIKECLKRDQCLRKAFLKNILSSSGHKARTELAKKLCQHQYFFSWIELTKELRGIIEEGLPAKQLRRIFLFFRLLSNLDRPFSISVISALRDLTTVPFKDKAARRIKSQLEASVHVLQKKESARLIIDLYAGERLNSYDIVFGFSFFTTEYFLVDAIFLQFESEALTLEASTRFLVLLSDMIRFSHNDSLCSVIENKALTLDETIKASGKYLALIKNIQMRLSVETANQAKKHKVSLPCKKIDFEKTMKTRFKGQKYQEQLKVIAFDLKQYAQALFSKATFEEFLSLAWLEERNQSSAIDTMIDELNRLTQFAQFKILERDKDQQKRQRVLAFFIDLCHLLTEMGDFHSSYALYAGIHSSEIRRLSLTWKKLGRAYKEKLEELDTTFDMSHNFSSYRKRMQDMQDQGQSTCPCLIFLKSDMETLLKGGSPDFEGNRLNVSKLLSLGRISQAFHRWTMVCQPKLGRRSQSTFHDSMKQVEVLRSIDLMSRSIACEKTKSEG